jgi:hypothetical protein
MIWKKTRISTVRHESGDFRITEDVEIHGTPFRLESFADGADPEYFPSLDAAKRAAATLNELALLKADNERLRAELDERRQADAFASSARRTAVNNPQVTELAAELVEVMQGHQDGGLGIPRTLAIHAGAPTTADD